MAEGETDAAQVYLLGKTYLANNQGQFYIRNDPIVQMAAGDRHTIIITDSGRAFAFGDNSSGQLGLGHTNNVEKVSCIKSLKFGDTGEKVILAACGRESSIVATSAGSIYVFGSNNSSQLGVTSPEAQLQPMKIEALLGYKWKQLAMGAEHACALTENGEVFIWGDNEEGQCGQPSSNKIVKSPRELRIDATITSISCGYYHTALVTEDGRLLICGDNQDRQLGRSMPEKSVGPIDVSIPGRVKAVACGHHHTVVLTESGEVYTCGRGDRGQLGLGHRVPSAETFEVIPSLPKKITAIAAGEAHTAVLSARGELYLFGDGKHGKLGAATQSNEFEACIAEKFRSYQVLKVVCGGCQTIVLAKKKSSDQKKSSESEEDPGNATLSVTQRPKSRARVDRNKSITGRSHNFSDSVDETLRSVPPLGKSNHLRVEPDRDSENEKSNDELSESLKSATFNQTHTLTNGRFRPTQSPSLNRTQAGRLNDDETPIRTGALDRTARLTKESDDLNRTSHRSPIRERPINPKKKTDSDEDKSSSDSSTEREDNYSKNPQRKPETKQTTRKEIDSDDSTRRAEPSPPPVVKKSISEKLPRKSPIKETPRRDTSEDDDGDDNDGDDDDDKDKKPLSSGRQPKKQTAPPTAARRGSLPSQNRPIPGDLSKRDGNQTVGARPLDNTRSSFRGPATKTLAKTTPIAPATNDTTKKETPPAPQPGFFSRLFGGKSATPPPAAPNPPAKPETAAASNSRACLIM